MVIIITTTEYSELDTHLKNVLDHVFFLDYVQHSVISYDIVCITFSIFIRNKETVWNLTIAVTQSGYKYLEFPWNFKLDEICPLRDNLLYF